MTKKKPKSSRPPGPPPERLKIKGNWKDAVKVAMKRGKPPSDDDGKPQTSNDPDA